MGYKPDAALKDRFAPTEKRDGRWLVGEVHDPRAALMEGVAGHAGLFATADDLAVYAQMLLNGGVWKDKRVLSALTVKRLTTPHPIPLGGGDVGERSYGWDVRTPYSGNRGELFVPGSGFGHTGWTGTSLWIDPDSETAVILLTNRVHPDGKGDIRRLWNQIGTLAAASLDFSRPEGKPALTGLDVLERDHFTALKGRHVGLVTNHTGVDRDGRSIIDLLSKAEGVTLAALFSPEHGIRGAVDEKVDDSKDEKTGLPVYSLYGRAAKPTAETLKGVDTLVFDIQDAGCRFYTYESTLGGVMEAAAENKIPVMVLDRPNPLGGAEVEGPVLDAGRESFVGYHTLPVRHGLTMGELARLFNGERKIGCDLEVIPLENWRRGDLYDHTGLRWVNPSPNLRSLDGNIALPRRRPLGNDECQRGPRYGSAVRVGRRPVDRRNEVGGGADERRPAGGSLCSPADRRRRLAYSRRGSATAYKFWWTTGRASARCGRAWRWRTRCIVSIRTNGRRIATTVCWATRRRSTD